MKRVIAIGLIVNAALLAGILLKKDVVVHAAAGGGQGGGAEKCAAKNGDVNADGTIDLSDAVTTLGYLFLGNPQQLLPLCQGQTPSAGLPGTGKTKCFDQRGTEIPCDGESCPGQDGFYQTGCPSEGRFVDNGDGTVTDHCTGLMWQQETADTNGNGHRDNQDTLTWCQALAYCEDLSFAGHDDWRLPNVRELQSIVDYGTGDAAIDPRVFDYPRPGADVVPSAFWSSTTRVGYPDAIQRYSSGWLVDFLDGGVSYGDKGSLNYVRAVRSGP